MKRDDVLTHNGDEPGALPTETSAATISGVRTLEAGSIGPVGYIVSAYVAGPSLEQWLRHNHGRVSPAWGARIDRSRRSHRRRHPLAGPTATLTFLIWVAPASTTRWRRLRGDADRH
jgi:hypothetical protein